jgi:hypothetical protein
MERIISAPAEVAAVAFGRVPHPELATWRLLPLRLGTTKIPISFVIQTGAA